jgi:hypothetical protein
MRTVDEHEMCGRSAHFRAGHHQPEMRGLNVFAAFFKTVIHRRAEANFITIEATVDAVR